MNCEEVQAQLSDYLEKALPTADLKIIEAHLSACALCRMETDYLSECIHQVASLPIVDPPIGFTQRVMARVREINEKPGFWERWLFPLRIKIPLQAAAVLVVGILAVYVLKKEPPKNRPLMTSETIVPESQFGRTEKNQETPLSKESQQAPAKSQSLASSAPVSKTGQTKTTSGANEKISLSGAKALVEERSDTSSPSSPPLPPTEAKGRGTGMVSGTPIKSSGQFPETVEIKSGSLRQEAITVEPFADYEMVFRLPSSTQLQPRRDNAGLSQKPAAVPGRQAGVGDLDRLLEVVAGAAQPQTVWLNVSKSQYEELKKALRAMGTIESETQVPLLTGEPGDQNNGQLQIKLTVLPAPETNRVTPSGDK
jgi:cytoskeletal protein RodZ